MSNYTTLITDHTPMRALPLPLIHRDPAAVASHLTRHGTDLTAIVLIGLDAPAATHVAAAIGDRRGPTVITEPDTLAAALAAATLTSLRHRTITPRHATIAVTAPDTTPHLGPLLAHLGVGPMITWHRHDADPRRIPPALAAADLLIDLDNSVPGYLRPRHTLQLPADTAAYAALVLPGLLDGLRHHPRTPITTELLAACARALALITPADQTLPHPDQRHLTPALSRAVTRALGRHRVT